MKLISSIIFISFYLLQTINCWWENGHMLVAQIAEIKLLKEHPNVYERANDIILAMGDLAYDYDNTFVTSAVWADDIKSPAMNFWDSWHFFGRPINPNGEYLRQDEEQQNWNAIDALERAMLELDDSDGLDITFQKAFFIRYVLHIIGDIHQPLHSVNMFNETYNGPSGDMGGNQEFIIDPSGHTERLHAFWDQGAEYFQEDGDNFVWRPFNTSTVEYMRNWGEQLMGEYPEDSFGDLSNNLNPFVWTTESWEFAGNTTYPWVYEHNQLTTDYQSVAIDICKQRVALGGYRLANTLVELYKDYIPNNNHDSESQQKKFNNDNLEEFISQMNKLQQKQESQEEELESINKIKNNKP